MGTTSDFIAFVLEQAGLEPRLTTRRMFGEYALYVDGKVVGFACDNSVFIKYTDATPGLTADLPAGEAYPGSKPYAVADALLDEPARLQDLLLATADALPSPRPGKASTKAGAKREAKQEAMQEAKRGVMRGPKPATKRPARQPKKAPG